MLVKEIYRTLQGETTRLGTPCVIIRLSACNLRCAYCDTTYALEGGTEMTADTVAQKAIALGEKLCVVTGGEPLLQPETPLLVTILLDKGLAVQVETNGSNDIANIDPRASIIMDLKCPSSGESDKNLFENLRRLKRGDEVKFVIATRADYDWAKSALEKNSFPDGCAIVFSWASPAPAKSDASRLPPGQYRLTRRELAELILADRLAVRFLPQLHKIIWGYDSESV